MYNFSENRFTPIYDFGYVAMNFGWVYPEDSGEYLCRATNLYGMDETRAIIKTKVIEEVIKGRNICGNVLEC